MTDPTPATTVSEHLGITGPEGWSVDQEIASRDAEIEQLRAERDDWRKTAMDLDAFISEQNGHIRQLAEELEATRERRQPYPTADAYEAACRALRKYRAIADRATALLVTDESYDPIECGELRAEFEAAITARSAVDEWQRTQAEAGDG